jgi:hypothetical protein
LEDYSITHPTIYLEQRAQSMGLSLDDFRVPANNVICLKLEAPALLVALNATPLHGLPVHHIGHLLEVSVGVTPMNGFGAPYLACLVEQLASYRQIGHCSC